MGTVPQYPVLQQPVRNYVLSPKISFFWVTVPDPTSNLFLNPSFEPTSGTGDPASFSNLTSANQDSTYQVRGLYSIKCIPATAAQSYYWKQIQNNGSVFGSQVKNDVIANTAHTFSAYVYSPQAEKFRLEVQDVNGGTGFVYNQDFQATGTGFDRFSITFVTPNWSANAVRFFLYKLTATTNPYWTDCWQVEAKSYLTTYCDGEQPGCIWTGPAHASVAQRQVNQIGGQTYNFKDLGLKVTGYQSPGMPPLQHTSQKKALQGGEFYERTLPTFRVLTVQATIEDDTYQRIQTLREALVKLFAPDLLTQQAKPLIIGFQTVDSVGRPTGKFLEMPATYLSGLEGDVGNLSQDKVNLQFTEFSPPSIQEQIESGYSLTKNNTYISALTYSAWVRTLAGTWSAATFRGSNPGSSNPINRITENPSTGEIMAVGTNFAYGYSVAAANYYSAREANAKTVGGGTPILTYFGRDGASNNLVTVDNLGTISAVAGTNNAIRDMIYDRFGTMVLVGDFTTPGNRMISYTSSGGFSASFGTGLDNTARTAVLGQDGYIYVGGDFATANGTSCTRVARVPSNGTTFSPLGTGMNGSVYCLVFGLDGKLYAAGAFTTAGGVAAVSVAVWNGTSWAPLGPGLNGTVYGLAVDPTTGDLYAVGAFTQTNDGKVQFPDRVARWNGSVWSPVGVSLTYTGTTQLQTVWVDRARNLWIGGQPASSLVGEGQTTINYTGSAAVRPRLVIRGPGTLYSIRNTTNGSTIYFNPYTLLTGEVLTLTISAKKISLVSNIAGPVIGAIANGSNIVSFGLTAGPNNQVGANNFAVMMTGTSSASSVELYYRNLHWSLDASGGSY